MEKLRIKERLQMYAGDGFTDTKLNLYRNQEMELIRHGFSVQEIALVADYPDEHVCNISWLDAMEGTFAHDLLIEAAENNPVLKKKLAEASNPILPPYSFENHEGGGWNF